MPSSTLGARKSAVLRAVVRDYIRTAEPVGSGRVAKRYRLRVSPATIRNDMAVLEDMGYLAQPHTSAGRIPTDRGYRFYVDSLPARPQVSVAQRRVIVRELPGPSADVEEVLRRTAHLLPRLTRYAAVTTPLTGESRVVRAELVPLGTATILLVVSDTGRVDKRVIRVPAETDDEALARASETLNRALSGLRLEETGPRARSAAEVAAQSERALLQAAAEALGDLAEDPPADHVFVGGVSNIAADEVFEHREAAMKVFQALEEETMILGFLRRVGGDPDDVTVRIGRENTLSAMRDASIVVTGYLARGRPAGAIAVIGPTRMDYPSAMATVHVVARRVSELIDALAG